MRMVVPWKYGYKSIKSIVKIRFVAKQPPTTWNRMAPQEYGFYSNVNPNVDHPRWSQAKERRLGEIFKRATLMFNGYGDQVASLTMAWTSRKIINLNACPAKQQVEQAGSFSVVSRSPGLLGWRALHGELTANPIEFITHATGDWTLRFLIITLCVTPLRKILGLPELIRFRRMLGLFAFFYACLHFTTYIWLDKFFDLSEMWKDIAKRKYITVGFTAFCTADSTGYHLHGGMDQASRRKTLADASSSDLCQRGARSDSLLLAGEVSGDQAANVRRDCRGFIAVEIIGFYFEGKTN